MDIASVIFFLWTLPQSYYCSGYSPDDDDDDGDDGGDVDDAYGDDDDDDDDDDEDEDEDEASRRMHIVFRDMYLQFSGGQNNLHV